jgi:simple sugar transport system substrate-binding protein
MSESSKSSSMTRRQALGVVGGLVVGGVVGAAGGYYAGMSSVPSAPGGVTTVTQTVTGPGATVTASAAGPAAGMQYGTLPSHPKWKFVVICHVTTNPFFVPTQYGMADADALFGTTSQWAGSVNSLVSEMVDAFNAAVAAKVDGIATTLIDPKAFNAPTDAALAAGIPVIGYNADAKAGTAAHPACGCGPVLNNRMAYVGQPLYESGVNLGNMIAKYITDTKARIALFIATPGTLNIQPRIDGASDALAALGYKNIDIVGTDPLLDKEGPLIDAYYLGHTDVKGMFAVDAGDTSWVGDIATKEGLIGKVVTGGFDLLPETLKNIQSGATSFTIDQQPYLQGFVPVQQLYLYKLSGGAMAPSDTNTSLKFVTKDNVAGYTTPSRFEGSTPNQPTF